MALRKGEPTTEPTLLEMTDKALTTLSQNPNGFFLMVEGAQVDKGNHEHDLPWATYELLEFDDAVKMALTWAEAHPDTLVLIAPDHETGGLTILNEPSEGARGKALRAVTAKATGKPGDYFVNYATTWHTGVDVFLAGNRPDCRPARNCEIIHAIAGLTAETLPELHGKTVQQDGVYWLETADGKRLRAQRDAIFVKTTGKWYNR